MFCIKCNNRALDGANFCDSCGHKIYDEKPKEKSILEVYTGLFNEKEDPFDCLLMCNPFSLGVHNLRVELSEKIFTDFLKSTIGTQSINSGDTNYFLGQLNKRALMVYLIPLAEYLYEHNLPSVFSPIRGMNKSEEDIFHEVEKIYFDIITDMDSDLNDLLKANFHNGDAFKLFHTSIDLMDEIIPKFIKENLSSEDGEVLNEFIIKQLLFSYILGKKEQSLKEDNSNIYTYN